MYTKKQITIASKVLDAYTSLCKGYACPLYDSQGRQIICDGFRAFRLRDPMQLPEVRSTRDHLHSFELIMNDAKENCQLIILDVPSPATLRAFISQMRKLKQPLVWDLGPELPAVSARYLLDLLTMMPKPLLYARTARNSYRFFGPIYAESKLGDAVLMPVRTDAKRAEYDELKAKGRIA